MKLLQFRRKDRLPDEGSLSSHVLHVLNSLGPDELIGMEDLGSRAWARLPDDAKAMALRSALGTYADRILEDERSRRKQGKPFSLADVVVANEYSYAGVLPDPDHYEDHESIEMSVSDIIAQISADNVLDALRQALELAIPTVIAGELDKRAAGRLDEGDGRDV